MIITIKFLCFLIIAIYVLYILWMYKALINARSRGFLFINEEMKISIIIAFRNEANNIILCLESLKNQNYSPQNFEIVLCNDHSEDKSLSLVQQFILANPQLKILLLENKDSEHGKKQAIKNAVKNASFDFLAFTDADCIVGCDWLKSIASAFSNNHQLKMLCGPVAFHKQNTFTEKLMSLEFASLMAVTAASILNKKPFICNAANMAIKKDAYFKIQGNLKENIYASGDDIFLLHNIKKLFGSNSIGFIYHHSALVLTLAPKDLNSFISQRIRWSSKTTGYSDSFALFSAWLVFIVCTTIASGLFFSFFYGKLVALFIALFFIKTFVDALLLHQILNLLQRKDLLRWILLEQMLYVFYVPIIALMSFKRTYKWKGRRIS